MITPPDRKHLPTNAPTIGYLCGGAGIGTEGFYEAGFRPLWNIDFDPANPKLSNAIAEIYEHNFGYYPIQRTLQEVAAAKFKGLKRPTGIVFSQPCCEFSIANPKGKESENEIAISWAAAEAILHFRPQFVVVENVPAYQKSKSWWRLRITLEEMNYSISSGGRNAIDFGVPQSRNRFLAIAHKSSALDLPIGKSRTIGWHEAIADRIHLLEDAEPTPVQLKRVSKLSEFEISQPLLVERIAWWKEPKVTPAHLPAPAIRKSLFIDNRNHSRSHAFSIRLPNRQWKKVGMREIARLFSIPDYFWIPENKAFAAGAAMGNGIPPLLTKALGEAILNCRHNSIAS